jgi:hypothetical protein
MTDLGALNFQERFNVTMEFLQDFQWIAFFPDSSVLSRE